MLRYHPIKFGSHRYGGIGDKMFLVVEEQHSICSRLNPPLLFISKADELKARDASC